MINVNNLLKKSPLYVLIASIICIAIFLTILLTRGFPSQKATVESEQYSSSSAQYNAAKLLKFKSPYVGDSSNVVNLLNNLPFESSRKEVSLKTDKTPYGISVNYDFRATGLSIEVIENTLKNNAVVLFSLINNLDEINFHLAFSYGSRIYNFTRTQLQKNYAKDLREFSKDKTAFETLLNDLSLILVTYPPKYTLTMSSTPGIRIMAQYNGKADTVEYSATSGNLLTWNGGKVSQHDKNIKLPINQPIYWSPLENTPNKNLSEITVKAKILNKNVSVAERQVHIKYDASTNFYTVVTSDGIIISPKVELKSQNPKSLDEAVSMAIKGPGNNSSPAELTTEGHIIIDTEEKGEKVKAYVIASFGAFGFENGIFTVIGGTGAISTVITFSKNKSGEYKLLDYKQPMDGDANLKSKKEMFPRRLWSKVLSEQKYYPELAKQQEKQAKEYLQSIGRNARVSAAYVEKKMFDLKVEASNNLLAEISKNHALNEFPNYWVGTREIFENGVRFIYETSQSKTRDGLDLITFRKTKEDGTVVLEIQYKIVGDEVKLVERE